MAEMPEDAEGGNERNGYAEKTNGPRRPEGCKEGVAMMGLNCINELEHLGIGIGGRAVAKAAELSSSDWIKSTSAQHCRTEFHDTVDKEQINSNDTISTLTAPQTERRVSWVDRAENATVTRIRKLKRACGLHSGAWRDYAGAALLHSVAWPSLPEAMCALACAVLKRASWIMGGQGVQGLHAGCLGSRRRHRQQQEPAIDSGNILQKAGIIGNEDSEQQEGEGKEEADNSGVLRVCYGLDPSRIEVGMDGFGAGMARIWPWYRRWSTVDASSARAG
ncbi:hypothetical protein B0H11DRAFT_1921195 [Mycena galericulata]|nr:hypothetical protein B0H11DRAFT_1921195 [Mycena galericulata]